MTRSTSVPSGFIARTVIDAFGFAPRGCASFVVVVVTADDQIDAEFVEQRPLAAHTRIGRVNRVRAIRAVMEVRDDEVDRRVRAHPGECVAQPPILGAGRCSP